MRGPVDTTIQVITQRFNLGHRGIDLRSVDFATWKKQAIVITEKSRVLRQGEDRYGNDFLVVQPLESQFDELKYIHVNFERDFSMDEILEGGNLLGYTQIHQEIGRGNSYAHHLHFEVWAGGLAINAMEYFQVGQIAYKIKNAA